MKKLIALFFALSLCGVCSAEPIKFTVSIDFEKDTLLDYAKKRGYAEPSAAVADEVSTENPVVKQEPVDFIREYWQGRILQDITDYIRGTAIEQAEAAVKLSIEDASSKLLVTTEGQ